MEMVMKMEMRTELETEFGGLFDTQLEILQLRGCSKSIIRKLREKKEEVIKLASTTKGDIPFVPVPVGVGIDDLMKMIVIDEREGKNYLEEDEVADIIKVPQEPYFIIGVRDGSRLINVSPREAIEKIPSPLTVLEGISLCIHYPNILFHHYLDLIGSRYGREIPDISLSGEPLLLWTFADEAGEMWGIPSCTLRF